MYFTLGPPQWRKYIYTDIAREVHNTIKLKRTHHNIYAYLYILAMTAREHHVPSSPASLKNKTKMITFPPSSRSHANCGTPFSDWMQENSALTKLKRHSQQTAHTASQTR